MPALNEGESAPDFSLPDQEGKEFSLAANLKRGPVVLAFFKISCPTCQFAFPYLDRIFHGMNGKANVVGISQDSPADTALFTSTFHVSLPILFDPPEAYPVSNAYDITHVPTIFLISPKGKILLSSVGWARQDLENLNRALAAALGIAPVQLFEPEEDIPQFRSGCGAMN